MSDISSARVKRLLVEASGGMRVGGSAVNLAVAASEGAPSNPHICVTRKDDVPYVGHIIQPHRYLYPACPALLGSPWVRGIAESLCGPSCMSPYNALIAKNREGGEYFPWHQDMTFEFRTREHRKDT